MPELFFTWALDPRRRSPLRVSRQQCGGGSLAADGGVRLEPRDDHSEHQKHARYRAVPEDQRRRTSARGGLFRQRAGAGAKRRFSETMHAPDRDHQFRRLRDGRIYARLEHGKWTWRDEQRFGRLLDDPDAKAGLGAVAADRYDLPLPGFRRGSIWPGRNCIRWALGATRVDWRRRHLARAAIPRQTSAGKNF